jgi:predicted dienelactone hydrolase
MSAPTGGTMGMAAAGTMAPPTAGSTAGANAGAGGMTADAGSDDPPAGDDEVNVAVEGPHAFDTFTEGAKAPEYAEGLVYYPTDSDGPFVVMILSPGLTANNTDYEIWGRVLASHGIVALLMQPTSTSDWNDARAVDLKAALGVVRGALNASGPLAGKLDTAHVGFMGQSMGGGGTLIAANEVGNDIQAAIPMEPYAPGASFPKITAPTLIIAAELDSVAGVSSNAFAHYNSIPATTKKIYMEGKGADHYYSTDRYEDDFDMNARYAVAFLKLYLEGDTRYETYLYGAEHEKVASELSRYLKP